MKDKKPIWALLVVVSLAAGAFLVHQIWPLLNPEITETAPLSSDCDLKAGPCRVTFADGAWVSFAIEPRNIPVVKPLQLEVTLDGLEPSSVEVDFQGTDMNMGYNRAALSEHTAGRFTGTAILPVCVRTSMEWEAKILLHTDRGLLAAPFRFITVTPGRTP